MDIIFKLSEKKLMKCFDLNADLICDTVRKAAEEVVDEIYRETKRIAYVNGWVGYIRDMVFYPEVEKDNEEKASNAIRASVKDLPVYINSDDHEILTNIARWGRVGDIEVGLCNPERTLLDMIPHIAKDAVGGPWYTMSGHCWTTQSKDEHEFYSDVESTIERDTKLEWYTIVYNKDKHILEEHNKDSICTTTQCSKCPSRNNCSFAKLSMAAIAEETVDVEVTANEHKGKTFSATCGITGENSSYDGVIKRSVSPEKRCTTLFCSINGKQHMLHHVEDELWPADNKYDIII